jgi:hypothetical protein
MNILLFLIIVFGIVLYLIAHAVDRIEKRLSALEYKLKDKSEEDLYD